MKGKRVQFAYQKMCFWSRLTAQYLKCAISFHSWGSGADPWGVDNQDANFAKCRHDDGMLEVVGLTGVVHLGQIQSGLRCGTRLAQGAQVGGRRYDLTLRRDIPVKDV